MFAVERLGSYISRGVYTVSGPFHPFGGAVDIIVVEQEDGSFKSIPWYVRFGKFQGILKATERVVSINVNGVDADFHMYLDRKGEAFFVREVDPAEGVSEVYPSSGDELELELDARADKWGTQKSKSYNYDANRTKLVSEFEGNNRKNLARTNSRRVRLFGLPLGRRSIKENGSQDGQAGAKVDSVSSLERAEIAADLLEVRWTTNLRTHKTRNSMSSDDKKVYSSVSSEANVALDVPRSRQSNRDDSDAQISCSVNPENSMEFTLEETYIGADLTSIRSNISDGVHSSLKIIEQNSRCEKSAVSECNSEFSQTMEDEKTDGNASSDDTTAINPNDAQENIGQCNAGEEILLKTSDAHVAEDIGTSAGCSAGDGFIVDILVKKEVEEVTLEESSTVDPGESLTGFVSEQSAEHHSASISRLKSLPLVPELENCSSALDFFGGPTLRINDKVTPPNNAEDEQFLCSDLDDSEVEKVEHSKTSLSGSEECLSQDSLGSSEDGVSGTLIFDKSSVVTCKPTEDNLVIDHPSPSFQLNYNRSNPISISKAYNDTGEEALEQVVESLPNVMFDGGDLSLDAPQPFSRSLDSTLETFKMVNNGVPVSSGLSEGLQQVAYPQFTTDMSQISEEIKNIISDPAVEVSLCRQSLFEGMGYEAAARAFNAKKLDIDKFLSLGRDVLENDELVVRIGGLYFPWDAALPIASAIGSKEEGQILEPKGMIAVGQVDHRDSEEVTEKSMNSRGGSWKIWPFSFKRSNSLQSRNSTSESAPQGLNEMVENTDVITPKVTKKKLRAKSPTSEQLASLNLKEGKNVVTFTFSTAMFGEQQVDARIFLWKWNARIVISDVDGTITKSDVLGQFMPLMGWDWSQTGVTHLFSAIKENGYQLLFLSARSISQAYHTRQFLFNLKQDGKALPEGPMLISPDGLFPSLYREVIRRAPHEFKIACLEDVKVLFPSDHHPFYAGFGNRDTDELSYLRVGIPRGKIFTINPKGEVVVNRRVDTKSYTSLHALVHDMFPPTTLHEQEDYNSWNFWRLPPPDAII